MANTMTGSVDNSQEKTMQESESTLNQRETPGIGMNTRPLRQLKTNRGLLKFILLTIITLGIYAIVFYAKISDDINLIASRYDGKKTMHYCLLCFLVAPVTLGIAVIVWYHRLSERIGDELSRRGVNYRFGASDFWLWDVLGALILIGPFVYLHKLAKSMNLLCGNYNYVG